MVGVILCRHSSYGRLVVADGYRQICLRREKGYMMKNCFVTVLLGAILCSFLFCLVGCGHIGKADDIVEQKVADVMVMGADPEATAQMGETTAEGHRRHVRIHRLNRQAMMEDIDAFFMLDKQSRLTELVTP
jgi:hypothetical protein